MVTKSDIVVTVERGSSSETSQEVDYEPPSKFSSTIFYWICSRRS